MVKGSFLGATSYNNSVDSASFIQIKNTVKGSFLCSTSYNKMSLSCLELILMRNFILF